MVRCFAESWPDVEIVQHSIAQLPWRHNICLLEKVKEPNRRLAYAMAAIEHSLTNHITRFLLELGQGFSFVGRQECWNLDAGYLGALRDILIEHLN